MASRSSGLQVTIAGDAKGLQRAVADADRSLGRLSKSADDTGKKSSKAFGGIGAAAKSGFGAIAVGAGAAGAGMLAFAKVSVDAANDVNESITKNRTLFGEYARDIEAFAKTSAASFGISRQAALEYTGVFGNLSRAIGISKKDSAEMAVQLTKLAADLASFNNTGIEDALDALRSGLVGETEPLRRFGVTLSATAVEAEAVRAGIVKMAGDSTKVKTAAIQLENAQRKAAAALKEHGRESLAYRTAANGVSVAQDRVKAATRGTVPDLNAQEKALASVSLIMRQTKNAQGDFSRTSGGLANQQRILKARFDDLKTTLGESLLPTVTRAVTKINDLITAFEGGREKTRSYSRGLDQAQKTLGEYGTAASDGNDKTRSLTRSIDQVKESLSGYFKGIKRVGDALGPYLDATRDVVAWTRRHKTVMDALDAAIYTPTENLEHLASVLKGIADATSKVISVWSKFKDTLGSTPLGGLIGGLTGLKDGIGRTGDGLGSIPRFGGGLMGADPSMAPVAGLASRFGLNVTSGLRPGAITSSGNRSYHSTGEALDVAGTPAGMKGFFNFMKNTMGSGLAELIYTPGGAGIRNGRSHTYSGQVAKDHFDHVHVAVDTGVPGVGDGIGQAVSAARSAGFRGKDLVNFVAIAGAESRYNAEAKNFSGLDHSIGFWQINQLAHKGRFGTDKQLEDPFRNARAAYTLFKERGYSPWTTWPAAARSYLEQARAAVKGGGGSKSGSKSREAARGATTDYDPEAMYGGLPTDRFGREIPVLGEGPSRIGPAKGGMGPPKGLPAGFEPPDAPDLPTEFDFLDLELARAEATPDTADDAAVMRRMRDLRQGELAGTTDPRRAAELTREITRLTEAIEGSNRLQQQRDSIMAEWVANQQKLLALTQQGPQLVAAVVAAVSGGIGGQLGLGFQTPGYAGGVANYAGGGTGRL